MDLAGFVITVVGTIATMIGLIYSRRAAQGVEQVRRTLAARVHHENVLGKLKIHRLNIMSMVKARKGGLPLEDEIAQVRAHLEELRGVLSPYGRDVDEIIHMVQSPTDDSLGRAYVLLPQLSRLLSLADNAMNKQTLANTGV